MADIGSTLRETRIRGKIDITTVEQATALWLKVQKIQYERGGYIGWANQNIVDAASNKIKGMVPSAFFNLGGWDYRDVWFGA